MTFPNIDPIAFSIMGWPVHWYGLAYMAAFLFGTTYLSFAFKKRPADNFPIQKLDDVFVWIFAGVILGGRLGYVLFYSPEYFMHHLADIPKMWQGGMSFHGGLLGVITGTYLYCLKHKLSFFDLMDRMAPTACIGLFLGRMANFINGELYGNVTTSPLGMIFPNGGALPRHPSQLYEAALEGIVLFILLNIVLFARKKARRMELSGLFLIGYGLARFTVEFFRARDANLTNGIFEVISMGQILCIPMIVVGMWFVFKTRKPV